MRKAINTERIEGRVYQHSLVVKTVANQTSANYGKEFIAGDIEVAVDEAGLNVIPVHFTYVTPTTNAGGENRTFTALKRILDGGKTWITDGKDEALKVRVDTSIALNDFYTQDGNLVSTKKNEGGFVTIVSELGPENERNTFTADMLITGVSRVEANPEKNIDNDYVVVKGAIFNFRNDLLPMEFKVKNENGIKYFEGLGASNSNPVYTKVWGNIISETSTTTQEVESAFGEPAVRTYKNTNKEWVITGTAKVPFDFGDEKIDVCLFSMKEEGLTIQSTYFFLSKIGSRVREVFFPRKKEEVWEKCDVIVTNNIDLINSKPNGKIAILINNNDNAKLKKKCEFNYDSLYEMLIDSTLVEKIKNAMNKDNDGILNKIKRFLKF